MDLFDKCWQLNYARYYMPRLFPHIDGRVVYIDDDCIVQGNYLLDKECSSLWNMTMTLTTTKEYSWREVTKVNKIKSKAELGV